MKVKNTARNEEDNGYVMDVSMSQQEAEFLINYALDHLVEEGNVEFNQSTTDEVYMKILNELDEGDFHKT